MKKGKKRAPEADAKSDLAQRIATLREHYETKEDAIWVLLETKWKLGPAIYALEHAANGMSLEANITLDGNCKVRFYDVLEGVAIMLRGCQEELDKAYTRINP